MGVMFLDCEISVYHDSKKIQAFPFSTNSTYVKISLSRASRINRPQLLVARVFPTFSCG